MSTSTPPPRRAPLAPISVAPMMDRTDRHYRRLMRFITTRTLLYTEMVVARSIQHGDQERLLGYDPVERPLSLQLGGDDPDLLAECARIAEDRGYDEVNLNVGCPSDRVQAGNFGVCLMAEAATVARCVAAMRAACGIEVTVKHRIGFDEKDRYEDMLAFVDTVAGAGCRRFTVHARKAWLHGLSPKENRTVPPLRYDDVWRLKAERPALDVEINGGIRTLDAMADHLRHVDAVMIGRAAWDDPLLFAEVDARFFGEAAVVLDEEALLDGMTEYAERWLAADPRHKLSTVVKPMLNLWAGQPGARVWRRSLTRGLQRPAATPALLREAWRARQEALPG
jgi:tRNA-dihydrouridine synthase A